MPRHRRTRRIEVDAVAQAEELGVRDAYVLVRAWGLIKVFYFGVVGFSASFRGGLSARGLRSLC